MNDKWRDTCRLYFSPTPPTDLEEGSSSTCTINVLGDSTETIRKHLLKKINSKVGTSLWMARLYKVISIPIAAVSLSKFFDLGTDGSYGEGLGLLNNVIFTATTYLSLYCYTLSEEIRAKALKMSKVYTDFKRSTEILTDSLKEGSSQHKIAAEIVINAFDNTLNDKKIKSIASLDNSQAVETSLNMLMALNTFLRKERARKIADDSYNEFTLTPEARKVIGAAFSNELTSALNRRAPFFNIIKLHWPRYTSLNFVPTQQTFAAILNTTKEELQENDMAISEEITETIQRPYSSNRLYKEVLEGRKGDQVLAKLGAGIDALAKKSQSSGVIEKLYKAFSAAVASLIIFNPVADGSEIAWYYKYAAACGALFVAGGFYSIYLKIKDTRTSNCDTYDKLQEVIRDLYARKLIDKNDQNEYVTFPLVENIHQIIYNTFEKINAIKGITFQDYKDETRALIVGKLYTALTQTFIKEYDENHKFKIEKAEVQDISAMLARELEPKINREILNSLATLKNPGKCVLTGKVYEESLADVVQLGYAR